MSSPRRIVVAVVAVFGAILLAAAVYGFVNPGDWMRPVSGAEITAMALCLLPWSAYFGRRAATRFGAEDSGSRAWNAIAIGAASLTVGNICAYLPSFVDFGENDGYVLIAGHFFSFLCRVFFCVALVGMRRAYLDTGLEFKLLSVDYAIAGVVGLFSVVLLFNQKVLFAYWSFAKPLPPDIARILTGIHVSNFLIYPIVFFLGLTMYRYAMQMGGGLVARAWGAVALYSILQPLHACLVALLNPVLGPIYLLAFDNVIVLFAFAALAVGPIYQIEATE